MKIRDSKHQCPSNHARLLSVCPVLSPDCPRMVMMMLGAVSAGIQFGIRERVNEQGDG
jgi:hypothetical protein